MFKKDLHLKDWIGRLDPQALFVLAILLGLFLWSASIAQAQIGVDLLLQKSQFKIDERSEQKDASVWGAYLFVPLGNYAFAELAHEQTDITYKTLDPKSQGDNGGALNLMLGPAVIFVGGHQVSTTDKTLEGAKTQGAGIKIYDLLYLSVGVEGYQSTYPNLPLTDATGDMGLEVNQNSPDVALSLFGGYVSLEGRRDRIVLSDSLGFGKTEFISNEGGLGFYLSPFMLHFSKWTGERIFRASNKALEVNSFTYLYQGGNHASIRLGLGDYVTVSLSQANQKLIEAPDAEQIDSKVTTASIVLRF